MNEAKISESNPARKKFTREVTGEDISAPFKVKPPILPTNENKDFVFEEVQSGRNGNGVQNEGGKNISEKSSQFQNDDTKETGEGAKESLKNPKGAGRHPAACECPKCVARRNGEPAPKQNTGGDKLANDLSKYKKVSAPSTSAPVASNPAQPAPAPAAVNLAEYISGALFLIAIDAVMPSLMVSLMGTIDSKYKNVDKTLLKLSKTEKDELEPLADAMVKIIFGHVHPALAFAITLGIIYAGKIMNVDEEDFKDAAEITQAKLLAKQKARSEKFTRESHLKKGSKK